MNRLLMLLMVCSALVLSACGQTGALYLPGHTPPDQKSDNNNQNITSKVDDALISDR